MYEFIRDNEIENIVLEHEINRKKIEDKSKELIKHAFEQISSRILLQIKLYVDNANQFKLAERSYEKRLQFKDRYKEYIEIGYNKVEMTSEDIEIIKGIMLLINQQLVNFPESADNLLEYERMLLVSTGLLRIKEAFNAIDDRLVAQFKLPTELNIDFSKYIKGYINNIFLEEQPRIMELIDKVIEDLNDPTQRKEVKLFLQFLESQQEVLKNFIYFNFEIEVAGVSHQLQQEKNQIYIYPLRQLFQEIHTTIGDIKHSMHKKSNVAPLSLKNVESIIDSNIMKSRRLKELVELLEDDKANTIDRVLTHVNDELRKISANELKALKKLSANCELHSYMIVELYSKYVALIEAINLENVKDEHTLQMLEAITTTLKLKFQSLKQKDTDFHIKKLDFYLECENDFLIFRQQFDERINSIVQALLLGDKVSLDQLHYKYNKLIEDNIQKNFQQNANYFSKEVLFEMRTFEDLYNQSIERLKDSTVPEVLNFVELVTQLYQKSYDSLAHIEIKHFIPEVGETFNGKLHEVIMVEESEDFKKGDIIRVQNCGFNKGEQILLRASVIVSK